MIPKIIHYVWIGGKMPDKYLKFVDGWRRLMPEYEFHLWTSLDELPKDKWDADIRDMKPGFASDYIRLKALYYYGGIYLDSDVETFKKFDDLLKHKSFIGYHYDSLLGTAVIGSEPKNPIIGEMLDIIFRDYCKYKCPTVSNYWVTEYYIRHFPSFCLTGKNQILEGDNAVYEKCYFEQPTWHKNRGGYSLHHCGGSWYESSETSIKRALKRIAGIKLTRAISEMRRKRHKPFWNYYKLQKKGIKPANPSFEYKPDGNK